MAGSLADRVDQVFDERAKVDNDKGSENGEQPGRDEVTKPEAGGEPDDRTDGLSKAEQDGKGGAGTGSGGSEGTDKAAGDDQGYIADESDDTLDKPEPVVPKPASDPPAVPSNLSPDLQYVVDNLPTLLVRGKTADGAVKAYQVKAAGQLPDDFEFATKRDELLFNQAIVGQEYRARELQAEYKQRESVKAATEFSEKENRDIRTGIGDLQREGVLGKFKYQPDDAKFANDPPVKEAQEVIDFMNKRNAEYLQEANKGGVLYHLGFKDAYQLYQATKSSKNNNDKQDQEDRERKQVSKSMAGASSAPSTALAKPRAARSMQELMDSLDNREY